VAAETGWLNEQSTGIIVIIEISSSLLLYNNSGGGGSDATWYSFQEMHLR